MQPLLYLQNLPRNTILLVLTLTALFLATPKAQAFAFITFDPDTQSGQNYGGNLGIDFNVVGDLTITQLGAFNSTGNDFTSAKTVQLWDRNDITRPMLQITIQPGQGTYLEGVRYVDITPITLKAGFKGTLSASGFDDTDKNYNTNVGSISSKHHKTTDPLVQFQQNTYNAFVTNRYGHDPRNGENPLLYPDITNDVQGENYQLPNASFRGQAKAPVPAPGSAGLMSVGLLSIGFLVRRRRK